MTGTPVHLLVTTPPGARSSMSRYADLVERALARLSPRFHAVRHELAPDPSSHRHWPAVMHNRLHHFGVGRSARQLARSGADGIWHLLDGSHAYAARCFPPARTVITCHDLIPLRMAAGEFGRRPRLPARLLIERSRAALAAAGAVVAVSRLSGRDAVERGGVDPTRVFVVPNPLDDRWMAALSLPRAPTPPPSGYVLHLGHDAAYKNRRAVWNIYRRIAPRWPGRLVIAGSPCSRDLAAEIAEAGLQDRVEFFPHPADEHLMELYRNASLFLFPSRFEGFGWPPLEAIACGCPSIASDVGGLRDVLGDDPPCLFDHGDEEGMARTALLLLENPAQADAWVAAGRSRLGGCNVAALAEGLARAYTGVVDREGQPR